MDTLYGLERDVETCAAERGLNCVMDNDRFLFLDLDSDEQVLGFYNGLVALPWLQEHVTLMLVTRSQNGNHHIYTKLDKEYDKKTRILWQTLLGSDPKRAYLDSLRVELGLNTNSNVLFETDEELPRVEAFLNSD